MQVVIDYKDNKSNDKKINIQFMYSEKLNAVIKGKISKIFFHLF